MTRTRTRSWDGGRAWPRSDRASATLEAAIGVPAFLLLLVLIIYGGRTITTHQSLESAASDAARSASIARNRTAAETAARQAAIAGVDNQDIPCRDVAVHLKSADFAKAPGHPGSVSVTVSCRLDLSDLSIPGVPGTRVLSATMSSPIDTWRERS